MADRFDKVFAIDAPLYTEGCPVIIVAGALLKDNQSGGVLAQIKFQNISERVIKAVSVSITALDTAGRIIAEGITHEYLDLSAKRDDTFGQKEAIILPPNSRGFTVAIEECVLDWNSVWNSKDRSWSLIPKQKDIKSFLNNDDDLVEQYRLDICGKANYEMAEGEGIWLCACGAVNTSSEDVCHSCGTPVASFRNFDLDRLVKRKESRLSTEGVIRKNSKRAVAFGLAVLLALVAFVICMGILGRDPSENEAEEQETVVMDHVVLPVLFTDKLGWIENESKLESGMRNFYDSTGILPYLYLADNLYGKNSLTENELDDIAKRLYDELFTDADGQVDENRVLVFILDRGGDGFFTGNVIGSQAFSVIGEEAGDILLENFDLDSFAHAKSKSQYFAAAFKKAGEEIGNRRNNTDVSNGNAGDVQSESYGTLKLLEDLNIRTGPGTNYSTTGVLKKGNTAKYYEVKSAEGYTWYRIGENSWIADDGNWIETGSSNGNSGELQSEYLDTLEALEDLNIRSGPGVDYSITGVLKKGTTTNFYEVKPADGYRWYRINDNGWVADDGTWINIFGSGSVSKDDVIDIVKAHATWIDGYIAAKGVNPIGWGCYYVIEDQEYRNFYTDVETFIPAGSFQGDYGVWAGTAGWSIYDFAYIKKGDSYELVDLFREDKDVPDYEGEAHKICDQILEKLGIDPASTWFIAEYDKDSWDLYYSIPGTWYRWGFSDDPNLELFVHPKSGYAYYEYYSEENEQTMITTLMEDFQIQ